MIKLTLLIDGFTTWCTAVYGPQTDAQKVQFLDELRLIKQHRLGAWMFCGHFNMVYCAADKNNNRLHRQPMGRFRQFLNELELKELHLHDRLYTWSNERSHPTLERIDRVFVSLDWEDRFSNYHLRSLSRDASDHAPLLLNTNVQPATRRRFRFESIWPRLPGYMDTIVAAWQFTPSNADSMHILDYKLRATAQALESWSQRFVGSIRMQLAVAREVFQCLNAAQDNRALTAEELEVRKELKCKTLGLSLLARTIARQSSRIQFLAEGDTNTRFFQLHACQRHRKNFADQGITVTSEDQK